MNKSQFLDMLRKHNFYYRLASNENVKLKGMIEDSKIQDAIKRRPGLQHVYDDYKKGILS